MNQTEELSKDSPLVTVEWLADNIDNNDIIVLDASWHMPNTGRNGYEEYKAGHIKGALFFDIDVVKDPNSAFPHMAPTAEQFARQIGSLGISNDKTIIVYDTHGIFTAPRVWWHFRYMGHKNIFVLDGGLEKWLEKGNAIEKDLPLITPTKFTAKPNPGLIRNFEQILGYIDKNEIQILDARSNPRFRGIEPEPRAGLKSGHIKGSKNLHYAQLVSNDGTMKPVGELKQIFANANIDLQAPIVTCCGSGVTACIIALALEIIGTKDIPIYDGSWGEWGARDGAIIESESL